VTAVYAVASRPAPGAPLDIGPTFDDFADAEAWLDRHGRPGDYLIEVLAAGASG
jgi:hypothetical protein